MTGIHFAKASLAFLMAYFCSMTVSVAAPGVPPRPWLKVMTSDSSTAFPTSFDVISIHPSDNADETFQINPDPNKFIARGASVAFLIEYAYHIHHSQLGPLPGWAKSARFDVQGKMDTIESYPFTAETPERTGNSGQEILERRIRSLLQDRFQIVVHKEMRSTAIYKLSVTKKGPLLKPSKDSGGSYQGPGRIECSRASSNDLAEMLSEVMDRVVEDHTGLTGTYAFSLRWTPQESNDATAENPDIFTALREQLGLQLISTKGSVEALFIDRVESPSAN